MSCEGGEEGRVEEEGESKKGEAAVCPTLTFSVSVSTLPVVSPCNTLVHTFRLKHIPRHSPSLSLYSQIQNESFNLSKPFFLQDFLKKKNLFDFESKNSKRERERRQPVAEGNGKNVVE